MSNGYNKNPIKNDNECEDFNGNTKWYIIHAEADAILKLTYSSSFFSCKNASIYITHSPCKECSKLIYLSKIKKVIFLNILNDNDGTEFLKKKSLYIKCIYKCFPH
ncbi:deaminase [Blattabacterium cuenoti]|uniref:deaminase n=1 Tax=Blattabacterium cuenoti TaxID=1653831 RepID=UPI00293BBEA6|nr:deaminase [Blattabacterium cuenoti]